MKKGKSKSVFANPPSVATSHLKELGSTSGDSSLISGLDSENCQRIIKVLI